MTNTTEYKIWCGMKDRCENPNSPFFDRYGGRGIAICERWLGPNGFENFFADMGKRPSKNHSIERSDNDGHYEPGNCVWATQKQQCRNRSNNVFVPVNGVSVTVAEAAELTGIPAPTIYKRLLAGWPAERAATVPVRKTGRRMARS